ncbi:MAG: hypothetical protein G3M78_11245 [Candidatus Nitrohelix vancouverensis]|uniref:Uncharacterized protein n=1 Tax=Candidatus Nitrohelix vancouverensis TaxID=2705534 RepID=A0A7T0C3Q2_9BACT|nr:MAG: hypothetical protein G3M78_11245 [Candidatus Nitrohelix vancouverensis]
MEETVSFEVGKTCPIKVEGTGAGLSFSPNGDMLLIGMFSRPTANQIKLWEGKWRSKLVVESEFPSIPIFAVGDESWIIEAPCNPAQQEMESPGFVEALFAKDEHIMAAILVDADTNIIQKISHVELDELFIERLSLSWNPYRHAGDQYNKVFTPQEFADRINSIFKFKNSQELWRTSW